MPVRRVSSGRGAASVAASCGWHLEFQRRLAVLLRRREVAHIVHLRRSARAGAVRGRRRGRVRRARRRRRRRGRSARQDAPGRGGGDDALPGAAHREHLPGLLEGGGAGGRRGGARVPHPAAEGHLGGVDGWREGGEGLGRRPGRRGPQQGRERGPASALGAARPWGAPDHLVPAAGEEEAAALRVEDTPDPLRVPRERLRERAVRARRPRARSPRAVEKVHAEDSALLG